MRTHVRTILIACLVIATLNNFATGIEVSSKVELKSDVDEDTSSNIAVKYPNESANPSESILLASEQLVSNWRHRSELVKSKETKKGRIHISQNNSSGQPKVISKIQIVVNSNDSVPSANSFKHGIRNVSISSKSDGKGNIVTDVRLSIVTNIKSSIQMDDVPVVEGFRGVTGEEEKQLIYHTMNPPINLAYSRLHNDIPQMIQFNQRYDEPWYQHRRAFHRPRSYWTSRNFEDRSNGFRGREQPLAAIAVDDKIESSLSKTKSNNDTTS